MRIAFLNRKRDVWIGGDLIAVDATIEALNRLPDTYAAYIDVGQEALLAGFDIAHLYHCNFDWALDNHTAVLAAGIPYVLTPLYYPEVQGADQKKVAALLQGAKVVLPFSQAERDELLQDTGLVLPCEAVPNGTSLAFHHGRQYHASSRRGVLCVAARGEAEKQCALVRSICAEMSIPFRLVAANAHITMPLVYASAKVFVNASLSERMSLTVGEALCSNCRVLATDKNRGNEWYPGLETLDPADKKQMEDQIVYAYALDDREWNYAPNKAARDLTWESVASRLVSIYTYALAQVAYG